ncbi:glycosyltransferase family 4 protein [Archangium violaceum]|uniref:glycosyltransferase n=1 Tax=Archangium violaceum TaxID=83451 RepID=UPI0019522F9A|nr:glycosyltransferase [Archangium violaceum]QRO01291.1 glycosyltransferase family 4 protein [Archangium violaceum]
MKIAFLAGDVGNISGGANVIIEYAWRLRALGHEVVLVTHRPVRISSPPWHPRLPELRFQTFTEAARERFDFVFATWWLTWFDLWRLDSAVYGYLNQSLESRFRPEGHLKHLNRITYSLPLLFVTEARWLAEFIRTVQPAGQVLYVRNGLSREHFPCVEAPAPRTGPLRVLVEGPWGIDFKGVAETFALLEEARPRVDLEVGWLSSSSGGQVPVVGGQPVRVHERIPIDRVREVYQRYDVMLKLSRVEGMFGPPLEMFSQGGTAITYTVTGSDEYMVHGENALLVPPHDRRQLPRYLEVLSASPAYLDRLRAAALRTARAFPDWETSIGQFDSELRRLHGEGLRNEHLRPALTAMATMKEHWLDEVRHVAEVSLDAGPGERLLLERYRKLKQNPGIEAVKRLVPDSLKHSVRAFFTRRLE